MLASAGALMGFVAVVVAVVVELARAANYRVEPIVTKDTAIRVSRG